MFASSIGTPSFPLAVAASAGKEPAKEKEYRWGRLAGSAVFFMAQVLFLTYPPLTRRLSQCLPSALKVDHDIWGTLANVALSVGLDLYLQSKKDPEIWKNPSRWNPLTISSFIFSGYVMGISCRNINAGLSRFSWARGAAEMGWLSRLHLPGAGPLLRFGLKSVVINTIATPLWAIGNLPWLLSMEAPWGKRCQIYWTSVRKNFEWGWTRRAIAFSFAPMPTHGLFYLFNHGGMAFQQMAAVDEATKGVLEKS